MAITASASRRTVSAAGASQRYTRLGRGRRFCIPAGGGHGKFYGEVESTDAEKELRNGAVVTVLTSTLGNANLAAAEMWPYGQGVRSLGLPLPVGRRREGPRCSGRAMVRKRRMRMRNARRLPHAACPNLG